MSRTPESFRVGDVVIAGNFTITPLEVANHLRSRLVDELIDTPRESAARFAEQPQVGGVCPTPLMIARALQALRATDGFGNLVLTVHGLGKVQALGTPIVGEPFTCVGTVAFRGKERGASVPLTLAVELRRRRGGTLLRFEVGVELQAQRQIAKAPGARPALVAVA